MNAAELFERVYCNFAGSHSVEFVAVQRNERLSRALGLRSRYFSGREDLRGVSA